MSLDGPGKVPPTTKWRNPTCWSGTRMPPLRALISTGFTTLSSQATTDGVLAAALWRTRDDVTKKFRHLKHSSLHSAAQHSAA